MRAPNNVLGSFTPAGLAEFLLVDLHTLSKWRRTSGFPLPAAADGREVFMPFDVLCWLSTMTWPRGVATFPCSLQSKRPALSE